MSCICPVINTTNMSRTVCVCVGVCQLVNKMGEGLGSVKVFNRNDEQFLEAFAIFCGLGIQNTQMYETVERAMAKQEVTLEVSLIHTHTHTPTHYTFFVKMHLRNFAFSAFCDPY